MGNDSRILVVAAWGFPPSWQLYGYRVRLKHRGFKGFEEIGNEICSSCCSTLVLVSRLRDYFERVRRGSVDVNTIVFGLDSIVDPSLYPDIRGVARRMYEEWLDILADSCSCCGSVDVDEIRISVLPGIGRYYGYEFAGRIDHLFNKAFAEIVSFLKGSRYNWVFLDLTHGLNFQLVSVLYATIAATVLFGLENRLILVNSEPATGRKNRCINIKSRLVAPETLNILDVTRLQKVIRIVRAFAGLKRLETWWLRDAIRELGEIDRGLVEVLEKEIEPFFKLLKNGLVALAFPEAKYVYGNREDPVYLLSSHPCRRDSRLREIEFGNISYDPILDRERKRILYSPDTSIYESLRLALRVVVEEFCTILAGVDEKPCLLDFMDKLVEEIYRRYGYTYAELITKNTLSELKGILSYLKPALGGGMESSITVYTYRLLWAKKHELIKLLRSKSRVTLRLKMSVDEVMETVKRVLEEKRGNKTTIGEEQVRNAIAHSGLEFSMLEEFRTNIVDGRPRIVEVVYNEMARKLVEYISRK